MNIDVKGHSGCNINIISKNDKYYIKKESFKPGYARRLYEQGMKQANDVAAQDIVGVPEVYDNVVDEDKDYAYILMDYIHSQSFVDFFEGSSRNDIFNVLNKLLLYINKELSGATIEKVSKKVFTDKFASIMSNCAKNDLLKDDGRAAAILDRCAQAFDEAPAELTYPIGRCHGDLTFSNILFTSNKIYFIDYLDSFLETPLQDIVKLRQDTKYMWSTQMYTKPYDKIRLKIIFSEIDNVLSHYIDEIGAAYGYNANEAYDLLQLMNILRILPYVKKEEVKEFVLKILENILKNDE